VQIGLGVEYTYDQSTQIANGGFADSVANAWVATRPLLELMGVVSRRSPRRLDRPSRAAQNASSGPRKRALRGAGMRVDDAEAALGGPQAARHD
jgi:hypothetical protein